MPIEALVSFTIGALVILKVFCAVAIYIMRVCRGLWSAKNLPAFLTIDELREDYETYNSVSLDDGGGER